ncbi:DUF5753 domain-containing protein [Glycomyces sp. MUSA5-2]|uniref:DUF5753 domain-containing protein n=1 Tax=Glycomyces sp. MUSA5-2 TaxID=2053002 RepID=UPI00300A0DC0
MRGWWDNYRPYINGNFTDYLWLEENARTLNVFSLTVMPGLLQTLEHTTALIEHGPEAQDKLKRDRMIEARQMRHRVLDESRGKQFRFLVHEPVLYQKVGGSKTVIGQYEHLLEVIDRPHVELRLLPQECWRHIAAGVNTENTHFKLPERLPDALVFETAAGEKFLEAPDLNSYVATYDVLWSEEALDEAATARRIKTLMKDVKQ